MAYIDEIRAENLSLQASLRAADEKIKSQAAEIEALTASRSAEISKRAAAAERSRIKGILTCPEADGRLAQAQVLAFESDMSEDLAAKVLAAQPKEATATRLKTIAERAEEQGSAGGGFDPFANRQSGGDLMAKAVHKINAAAQFGREQK